MAKTSSASKELQIRIGKVESVDLYEIKDNELDTLEKGGPADLQFNFGIVFITTAFSICLTFASATFANAKVEMLFMLTGIVTGLLGVVFMCTWLKNRKAVNSLCMKIRQRIPSAGAVASNEIGEEPVNDDADLSQ
jgi:hypothetical protein